MERIGNIEEDTKRILENIKIIYLTKGMRIIVSALLFLKRKIKRIKYQYRKRRGFGDRENKERYYNRLFIRRKATLSLVYRKIGRV